MAEQTINCTGSCTVTVVHELSLPPLQLTPEEGAQIALAILGVWVIGWGVRQLVKLLNTPAHQQETES